jgi:hypothetical protein
MHFSSVHREFLTIDGGKVTLERINMQQLAMVDMPQQLNKPMA